MKFINYLILYGTIIEIILIVLIVLITIIFKIVSNRRINKMKKTKNNIELYLMSNMVSGTQVTQSNFDHKWKKIDILLPMVTYFDKYHSGEQWNQIRTNLIRQILLPLARTASLSNDWMMRHFAAEAFTLYSENIDEKHILKLINDPIPLVRYSAAAAGIIYGSQSTIQSLIKQMSNESWLTQSMYMQGFDNIPSATHYIIERLLKISSDSAVRATCYNILLKYPVFVSDWDINKDIDSNDTKLALVATQYLAYSKKIDSIETLIKLLSHPDWKMQSIAISCLGDMKVPSTISYITKNLNSRNWWVRFSARQALQKFGNVGKQELVSRNINDDEIHIDISRQLLNTF